MASIASGLMGYLIRDIEVVSAASRWSPAAC